MSLLTKGTMQAATVIAKTTETVIGGELNVRGYDYITLFIDYVNGDETGVNIYPYFLQTTGGTEYQLTEWATAGGVYTNTDQKLQFTATASTYVTFDIQGAEIVKFYQGGSNNDGTPTGTLAVNYTLKAG